MEVTLDIHIVCLPFGSLSRVILAQPSSARLNLVPLSAREETRSVWTPLSSLSHSPSESFHIHYVSGWSPASDI